MGTPRQNTSILRRSTGPRHSLELPIFLGSALLLYALLFLVRPSWMFNVTGKVDHWGYFGMLLEPVHYRQAFPSSPNGDMLALIWPSALFYKLASPLVANYLIRLFNFLLLGAGVFGVLNSTLGWRTAAFSTLAMLTFNEVLRTLGCDYAFSRIPGYLALSLWAAVASARSRSRSSLAYASIAGMFWCFVLSCNVGAIIYLPTICAFHALCRKCERRSLIDLSTLAIGGGALVTFGLLCLANYSYSGSFFFLAAIFHKATGMIQVNREHWPWIWQRSSWLVLPLSLGVYSLTRIWHRVIAGERIRFDYKLNFQLFNIIAFSLMGLLELVAQQETISNNCYFNHLLPFWFLALGGIVQPRVQAVSLRFFGFTLGLFLFGSLGVLWIAEHNVLTFPIVLFSDGIHLRIDSSRFSVFFWAFAFLALFHRAARPGNAGLLIPAIAIVCCNFICMPPIGWDDTIVPPGSPYPRDLLTHQDSIQATVQWVHLMDQIDYDRKAYFWFNWNKDKFGPLYRQFSGASHFWREKLVNEAFPDLSSPVVEAEGQPPTIPKSGRVIILSSQPGTLEAAKAAFAARGIKVALASTERFAYKQALFDIYLCDVKQ